MYSIPHGMQRNIVLIAGETLTVTGGGRASVWQRSDTGGPTTLLADLINDESITRGPYPRDMPFRLDATSGPIAYSTSTAPAGNFKAALERATDVITAAADVVATINRQREPVTMTDSTAPAAKGVQLSTFAAIPTALDKLKASLGVRGQRVLARIEATDARGAAVEAKANAFLDATDAALDAHAATYDLVEAATNNPPSDGSPQ